MNLPITTLEEAWGPVKNIAKSKQPNKFKDESFQSDLLNNTNLDHLNAYNHHSFSNIHDINHKPEKMSMETVNRNTSTESNVQSYYPNEVQYSTLSNEDTATNSNITITDPLVLEYLSKYNEEYKMNLVNRVLNNYIKKSKIESFIQNQDFETLLIISFLIFLLYQKIISLT